MSIPADLKYTPSHEWVRVEADGTLTVGITHHAQDLLGDMVFIENPAKGRILTKGEECAVVESVKAAADLYMPAEGEVVEVNEALRADPSLANTDPMGNGWFFKVHVTHMEQFDELMDPPAYDKLLKNL